MTLRVSAPSRKDTKVCDGEWTVPVPELRYRYNHMVVLLHARALNVERWDEFNGKRLIGH
jgi:hypothetical protein